MSPKVYLLKSSISMCFLFSYQPQGIFGEHFFPQSPTHPTIISLHINILHTSPHLQGVFQSYPAPFYLIFPTRPGFTPGVWDYSNTSILSRPNVMFGRWAAAFMPCFVPVPGACAIPRRPSLAMRRTLVVWWLMGRFFIGRTGRYGLGVVVFSIQGCQQMLNMNIS